MACSVESRHNHEQLRQEKTMTKMPVQPPLFFDNSATIASCTSLLASMMACLKVVEESSPLGLVNPLYELAGTSSHMSNI